MKTNVYTKNLDNYKKYKGFKRAIHNFFSSRNKLHAETPYLSSSFEPTSSNRALPVQYFDRKGKHDLYLMPWADHYYLRLLADGLRDFYTMQRAFRNNETSDQTHLFEFDMLEFYQVGGDYKDMLQETKGLLSFICGEIKECDTRFDGSNIASITVEDAFEEYTNFSKAAFWDTELFLIEAKTQGYPSDMTYEEIWLDVVDKEIEPNLGHSQPTILKDFPLYIDSEGVINSDGKTIQRFELFIKGIEIGNCYTINVDGSERSQGMENIIKQRKEENLSEYAYDRDLIALFKENKIPPHSSMTIGVERLAGALLGVDDVRFFKLLITE